METNVKSTANATGANTDKKDVKGTTAQRPSISPADAKKEEPAKGKDETKGGNSPASTNQPANPAQPAEAVKAEPAAEPSKKEIKEQLNVVQVRGLDDTVKLVEQLGKKIAQKNKLSTTIGNLDSFVITQNDDKDDVAGDSKFMRCELTIADDGGEEFTTKNPFIIAQVVEMVKKLCLAKLAEVEAEIVIPA